MSWLLRNDDRNDNLRSFMRQVMRVSEEQLNRLAQRNVWYGRSYTFMRFLCLLDFFVGVPLSKAINGNRGRWASYGAASDYDLKWYGTHNITKDGNLERRLVYGVEYRTPPSFLKNPELYFVVMRTVTKLLNYLSENSTRDTFELINPMTENITGRRVLQRVMSSSYNTPSETYSRYRTPEAGDYQLIKLLPKEVEFMMNLENYDIGLQMDVDTWIQFLEELKQKEERTKEVDKVTVERGAV